MRVDRRVPPREIDVVYAPTLLQTDGSLPPERTSRARALRMAQLIEYGGPLEVEHGLETLIPCKRRPGGVACPGLMWVAKREDHGIHVFCLVCDTEELLIFDWEDTDWAQGPMEPVGLDDVAKLPDREADSGALLNELSGVLRRIGCSLSAARVQEIVATAARPTDPLHAVLAASKKKATRELLANELGPLLMDLWNATPRPELGGKSPNEMERESVPARAEEKIGRNAACPCGSGKKYKKCCGAPEVKH